MKNLPISQRVLLNKQLCNTIPDPTKYKCIYLFLFLLSNKNNRHYSLAHFEQFI